MFLRPATGCAMWPIGVALGLIMAVIFIVLHHMPPKACAAPPRSSVVSARRVDLDELEKCLRGTHEDDDAHEMHCLDVQNHLHQQLRSQKDAADRDAMSVTRTTPRRKMSDIFDEADYDERDSISAPLVPASRGRCSTGEVEGCQKEDAVVELFDDFRKVYFKISELPHHCVDDFYIRQTTKADNIHTYSTKVVNVPTGYVAYEIEVDAKEGVPPCEALTQASVVQTGIGQYGKFRPHNLNKRALRIVRQN